MSKSRGIHKIKRYSTMQEALERNSKQEGECIVWTAGKHRFGYGCFTVDGKAITSHRAAWQVAHGDIPPGMEVCHRCDNASCVRVEHLFLGTHADNMRDMLAKGRNPYVGAGRLGETNPASKLTWAKVIWIRYLRSLGATHLRISELVGHSRRNIASVCAGQTWKIPSSSMEVCYR